MTNPAANQSFRQEWWWKLLRRAPAYAGPLAVISALSLAGIGFNLLRPWPLKIIVDYVLPGRELPSSLQWVNGLPGSGSQPAALAWMTVSTVLVFLLGWMNTLVTRYLQTDVGARMTYGMAAEVFAHVQRLSLGFLNRRPTGDLVKRVAVDCRCIRELVLDVCLPAATALGTLIAAFAVLWRLDAALTLLAFAVIPMLALATKVYLRRLMDREFDQAAAQSAMMAQAEQVLAGIPIIQAFGSEPMEAEKFAASTAKVEQAYIQTTTTSLQYRFFTGGSVALGTALLMTIGGTHVLAGKLSVGDLLLFTSYLSSFYAPLETIAYLSTSFASAAAGARRVFELIDSDERIVEAPDAVDVPQPGPGHGIGVEFEDVSFSYESGREVLHRISLSVEPGQSVALVGPTGAGKTTAVSLLLRLHDPDSGRVTFNGIDVRNFRIASLRESVAIVLQDPFLLPMTVAENIAYARPNAPRADVIAAARAAHAEEFIEQLPNGYDTVLGERGATLSGGQRQRLAIARAFLKNSPILILDEPTSALDTKTEALVLEASYRLMQGRTTFIIAHRFSATKFASRIVALDGGEIVESGTHDELLAAGGLYRRLFALQSGNPQEDCFIDLATKIVPKRQVPSESQAL
jgi:ABC-type multidrug transport system fused ATPase/permease subunit